MYLRVSEPGEDKPVTGVVFTQHGRAGSMNSPHELAVANAYREAGYRVISLDATNSQNNNSDGPLEDFTMRQHITDLADAIEWAKRYGLIVHKFSLAGHSMGGFSALYLAATKYRDEVEHVLAYAPFTDGTKQIEARKLYQPDILANMRVTGFYNELSDNGKVMGRLTIESLMEWEEHSLYPVMNRLTMPVHVITGSEDTVTPLNHVGPFATKLPHCKGIDVIPGAGHDFSEKLEDFQHALKKAVQTLTQEASAKPQIIYTAQL